MRKFFWASILAVMLTSQALGWQKQAVFPNWKGYIDDTLAMNSMMSFKFWHGQGQVHVKVSERTRSFRMFVNGHELDTSGMTSGGSYDADISAFTIDGMNTLQVSNIEPLGLKDAVTVSVPYPEILEGTPEDEGIHPEALALISRIISSDVEHGFPSAQLAVIRNGRLVFSGAWGTTNTSKPDSPKVTTNTLYDLASVSKMLGLNFAVQKLVTDGLLDVDARLGELLPGVGKDKAGITVKDLLCHRSGLSAEVHYHDRNYDLQAKRHNPKSTNPLYTGMDGSQETRAKTLNAILRTPLSCKPRTKTVYSDTGYMLLCFIVEKIAGKPLDEYLRENFWTPLGLTRIAYNPLEHGFTSDDCAATELKGNTMTRGALVRYDGLREYTVQGEVHDEKAYYSMAGVSGHAGLFANAETAAKLASLMLTGGYGEHKLFSQNVIDMFTSPQDKDAGMWGIGWWREGTDKRPYYFGTEASSWTVGHQGFTGTLVMIDPSRNLVIAYLTNKLNSPAVMPLKRKRTFAGSWYTASTLGFVAQILGVGMDAGGDVSEQLEALIADMAYWSVRLIPSGAGRSHPAVRNAESKIDLLTDEETARRLRLLLPK